MAIQRATPGWEVTRRSALQKYHSSNKTYSPHYDTLWDKFADLPRISAKLLGLLVVAKITLLLRSSSWHTGLSEEGRRYNPQRSISLIAFLFQIIANNWITFSFLVALGPSHHNGAELSNRLCAVWFRCFCSEWVSPRLGTTRSAAKHVDARAIVASPNLFIRIVTEPGPGIVQSASCICTEAKLPTNDIHCQLNYCAKLRNEDPQQEAPYFNFPNRNATSPQTKWHRDVSGRIEN